MAIDVAAVELAIRTAVSVASGLPLAKIIMPRQVEGRPAKPYVTVDMQTLITPFTAQDSKVQSTVYDLTVLSTANGAVHKLKIGDTVFSYTSTGVDTPATVAATLVGLVNADAIDVTGAVVSGPNYTLTSDDADVPILVYADQRQEINSGDESLSELEIQATVSLLFYGKDTYGLAATTKHALRLQEVHDALANGGVTLFRALDVLSVPELMEDKWEERHGLELFIGLVSVATDNSGTIDSVEGSGTVTPDGGTPIEFDFEVSAL